MSLPSYHIKEQNRWEISSLEQNYKVMYHTITSLWVVFGQSTPSTLQSTPCWNLNRKSRFNALSTCEWQLYPQGSLGATLISPSTPTRFWVGKIGANQVWKVLCTTPHEIWRRTFLKVYYMYNTRGTNRERINISQCLSDPLGPNPFCVLDKISLHQVNFEGLLLSKSDNNACPSPTRDSPHQTHRLALQHFWKCCLSGL